MHRSLSVRIATLVFIAMMAMPAVAAPPRDDSPIGSVERAITRVVRQIRKAILPLSDMVTIPK